MQQEKQKCKSKQKKLVIIVCIFLSLSAIISILLWAIHIRQLRTNMNDHIDNAVTYIEEGSYSDALEDFDQAMELAYKINDTETIELLINYSRLASAVIRGDDLLDLEEYTAALTSYSHAKDYALKITDFNTDRIEQKIARTETFISFYTLIENAQAKIEEANYNSALQIYKEAITVAYALSFGTGVKLAQSGITDTEALIIEAKRQEAMNLYVQGNQLYWAQQYAAALNAFFDALEIFVEVSDTYNAEMTQRRIDITRQKQEEQKQSQEEQQDPEPQPQEPEEPDDTPDDDNIQNEPMSNYDHNTGISFDLRTLIDNQNQRPANQIRMGATEGMNEGWYNGCGWVATYNALILLDDPKHPADIVRHFETSGGTVMGGIFGTYPNAIEGYLKERGFTVNHTLFPQLRTNIDDEIRKSRVSILAYAHSNAAHYVTVEYREDLELFVIYNDSFARTVSSNLGLRNKVSTGAAVDSVASFINTTSNILFSFSLITVS